MHNPYAPPETVTRVSIEHEHAGTPSKPIIPAVIGMFTYGSTSPYALVLCVEHYLNPNFRPVPWSTHIAAVLATIGSFGWFALNVLYAAHTIDVFLGNSTSMYSGLGLMMLLATLVFFGWACWRTVRFIEQMKRN